MQVDFQVVCRREIFLRKELAPFVHGQKMGTKMGKWAKTWAFGQLGQKFAQMPSFLPTWAFFAHFSAHLGTPWKLQHQYRFNVVFRGGVSEFEGSPRNSLKKKGAKILRKRELVKIQPQMTGGTRRPRSFQVEQFWFLLS